MNIAIRNPIAARREPEGSVQVSLDVAIGTTAKVANRLIEAHERHYWTPDEATLAALKGAGEELEDRLEGIVEGMAA